MVTDDATTTESAQTLSVPEDPFDRGTPRTTMDGYLTAARRGDFERATEYLDFRNLPGAVTNLGKPELAEQLYQVLNRSLWIDLKQLSLLPEGKLQDGLPPYRDALGRIETSKGKLTLLLQRVPRGDGVSIWKISNATVAKVPDLAEEFAYGAVGQWLSDHAPRVSLLNVPLWVWLMLVAILGSIWFALWLLMVTLLRLLPRRDTPLANAGTQFMRGPLCLILALALTQHFIAVESLGVSVAAVLRGDTLWLISIAWALNGLINWLAEWYLQKSPENGTSLMQVLVRPGATVAKSLMLVVLALIWLENLGFSPTAALAGLGIGGLAFALAAQKSVENMIGALTLYLSSPVKVGHLCRFGSQVGVVEEIGLRATRVRTLDRSVVHIPNASFVDMQLENISQRERIAYRPLIHLDGRHLPQNLELPQLLEQMRQVLAAHEQVATDVLRVRFKAFDHHALVIDVLAYITTTDYSEYLTVAENLNLGLLECIQSAGARLAGTMVIE